VMCIIQGITLGTVFIPKSIVADVTDYDELLSGKRREAFYMMAAEFFPKFSQIPSQAIFFFLLATFDYQRPGDWTCAAHVPDEAWCASQKPHFNSTLAALVKYSSKSGDCGNCAVSCCVREDPAQPTSIVWLLKISFGLVPCVTLLAACLALLAFPKAARSSQAQEEVRAGVEAHRNGETAKDPFYPGRILGPPPESVEHAGLLMHFWPKELLAVVRRDRLVAADQEDELVPDYQALKRSCLLRIFLGVISAVIGVILVAYGWEGLQSDLGGSVSPIGAMFLGFAVLIIWFNGVRLRASREVAKEQIGYEEICRHYNYLCRYTGYTEIELGDPKAKRDTDPPATEPAPATPHAFPMRAEYSL